MDLTLRAGINLQEAIQTAKEINQKSKLCGFNQVALDQTALLGYANVQFEVNSEEGLDLVGGFYTDQVAETEQIQSDSKTKLKFNQSSGRLKDIQQDLKRSIRALN